MDIQDCWTLYLKAEELNSTRDWAETHQLYTIVLAELPEHIYQSQRQMNTKPCQMRSMLDGLRKATIHHAEILNRYDQVEQAYQLLTNTYNFFQFMALDDEPIIRAVRPSLYDYGEFIYCHIFAFCSAQQDRNWCDELNAIEKSHSYFSRLQRVYETETQQNTKVIH